MGLVGLLAAAGITVYLAAIKPARPRPRALPTTVMAVQTVGLVATGPHGSGTAGPWSLLASRAGLAFSPVPRSRLVTGLPQWTADQMAGATYIFIYGPSGQCLGITAPGGPGSGAAASPAAPRLVLQPCDLSASQRWRSVHAAVTVAGHSYRQFASLSTGRCISVGGPRPAAGPGESAAGLTSCSGTGSWRQLISFWWGT